METRHDEAAAATRVESWVHWPVYWSAIWVGTLAALALALIVSLVGLAVGAQALKAEPWVELKKIGIGAVVFAVAGTFFSFVLGGWVAGRVAGIRRSEPAMLHGAIVWLVAVPLLVLLAAVGAGKYFGGWYGGLSGRPDWAAVQQVKADPNATAAEKRRAAKEQEDQAAVVRNTALGALTALLLGLVGSVIGGWMASGEPMTFTHYRTRHLTTSSPSAFTPTH